MIIVLLLLTVGVSFIERCDAQRNITNIQKPEIQAVVEAATYLLSQRNSDYGWDDFTPRALIAMAFAEKILPIPKEERVLMQKRLDVHILLNLMRNGKDLRLANLALYINALYAMCQNPRNFHGMDLVGLLRSETDRAMQSNFSLPLVVMTLCLAGETKPGDSDQLVEIYRKSSADKIGFKALTVIAISTCMNADFPRNKLQDMKTVREYSIQNLSSRYTKLDVYSKALVLQALSSSGYDSQGMRDDLMSNQRADGSFGNLLATYSAIPALLKTSLSNLKCKKSYGVMAIGKSLSGTPAKEMKLSIHITDQDVTHSINVPLDGNVTFFDVMAQAAQRDYLYRFKYEQCDLGKKVYSIAGIPNDAETGMLWSLYRGGYNSVIGKKNGNLKPEIHGVDRIFPKHGDHFVFSMGY